MKKINYKGFSGEYYKKDSKDLEIILSKNFNIIGAPKKINVFIKLDKEY